MRDKSQEKHSVTAACGACESEWETWGLCWEEPADPTLLFPGGTWILGRPECPHCRDESYVVVKSIHAPRRKLAATAGGRNR